MRRIIDTGVLWRPPNPSARPKPPASASTQCVLAAVSRRPSRFIDTDALIGLLRADQDWTHRIKTLEQQAGPLCTTDINASELYFGAHLSKNQAGNIAAVKGLLNTLRILSTNEDAMEVAAQTAADLKNRGEPLEVKELLIASMALVNGASILTGNTKQFNRIPRLEVLGPKE